MLLHQFIVVVVATAKRFESVLLTVADRLRSALLREQVSDSELQESETEQAA